MSTNFQIFPAVETALSRAEPLAAMHPLFRAEVRERMPRRGVQISFAPQVLHHDPAHAGTRANRGEYLSKDCQGVVDLEPGFYGDVWVKWVGNDLKCLEKKQKRLKKTEKNNLREI